MRLFLVAILAFALSVGPAPPAGAATPLLNVSYDPTRDLYDQLNQSFASAQAAAGMPGVVIRQSHGGSAKQARAVIDGLNADVVTLALGYDIDIIASNGLIAADWQQRLPHNSTPYYSTIVLLVRSGNPKKIVDWNDLAKPGISVISSNPKTSGGARWNFLAAWGYGLKAYGSEAKAKEFLTQIFRNVPILDSGARGATSTFVQRGQGDVLIAWENEALLVTRKLSPGKFEIITPSVSILAEPPVAVVDKNVDKKGTRKLAEDYLKFLYTPAAQEIIGRNFYRPRDAAAVTKYAAQFSNVTLLSIDKDFAGWSKAQAKFFNDGGLFDSVWEDAQQR